MLQKKFGQKMLEKKYRTYVWQTGYFIKSKIGNCIKFLENVQKKIILKTRKNQTVIIFQKKLETKNQQGGRGGGGGGGYPSPSKIGLNHVGSLSSHTINSWGMK